MEIYKNILVPFDFRDQAQIALSQSYNLAKLSNLDITLLYVHEDAGIFAKLFSQDQSDEIIAKIEKELNDFAQKVIEETGIKVNTMVARGKIHSKIVEVAEMIQAKFIVMGTASIVDNTSTGKKIVGANTSRVIRAARCPVITINAKHHYNGCRSILLPLDLTKETRQKVSWALDIAKQFGSTIKVVSVLWSVNHKAIAKQIIAQLAQVKKFIDERHLPCEAEIIEVDKESDEVTTILEYAKKQGDVDLIMIMTQQETSFIPFFVDSHATEIIRNSEIPVLSVIPKDIGETLSWK